MPFYLQFGQGSNVRPCLYLSPMSRRSPQSVSMEEFSVRIIQEHYGSNFVVNNLGDSNGYDLEIRKKDGASLVGIGEACWLENHNAHSTSRYIKNNIPDYSFELKVGQGQWVISIEDQADIKYIRENLPKLIYSLSENKEKYFEATTKEDCKDPIGNKLRSMRIISLTRFPDELRENGKVIFNGSSSCAWGTSDMQNFADEVSSLLDTCKFIDNVKKLNQEPKHNAIDKHLFLFIGSALSLIETLKLSRKNNELPLGEINFPQGITHIWIISTNPDIRSLFYSHNEAKYLDIYIDLNCQYT